MHEASLTKALMRRIDALATEEDASRVTGVSVWLGALSHMSPDHFREHFEHVAQGTLAEGAALEIETSDDIAHADAQEIRLVGVELDA